MLHTRTHRHRLAAAVTAVLAVTATGLATPAVAAAPPASVTAGADQATDQQDALTMPAGVRVAGSGPTGFLSSFMEGSTRVYTWTRHQDGAQTTLPGTPYGAAAGTDIVIRAMGTTRTHIDMSTGTELMTYDTSTLGGTYAPKLYLDTGLIALTNVNNQEEPHLFSQDDQGRLVDHKLTGLPEGATYLRFAAGTPGTVIVHYLTQANGVDQFRVALVDTASASVIETYDTLKTTLYSASAVSPTHVAWIEWPDYNKATLAVVRRGGTEVERTPLGEAYQTTVQLMGDWVVSGVTGGVDSNISTADYTLTARPLKGGETVDLLDHATNTTQSSDGSLIATGGTVGQGEGLYRITPDETGTPAASLLVTTGVPTALVLKEETPLPSGVIDRDRNGGSLKASWTFVRHNARVLLTIRHTASGKQWTSSGGTRSESVPYAFEWNGTFSGGLPAYNGDYTWTMTAKPANGIGPDIVRTGGFTMARAVRPHDFNDNGTSDLLIRDRDGQLRAYDSSQLLGPSRTELNSTLLSNGIDGTGWEVYDRLLAPGNLGGSPQADLLARDKSGVLWLHPGAVRALAPRVRIGAGWQIYDKLAAGSDVTGDGRPDLVATDKTGVMYLYKGTGNASAPLANRTRVGAGWGIYNQVTAVGNAAGAPAGDLVARDKAGVLWMYLGNGNGTFASRIRVGGGWQGYADVFGFGDADRDGIADLMAYDIYGAPYLYKGTGSWRAPYASRSLVNNAYGLGGSGTVTRF
ncbi:VCBS repeat-containing protein [Streptomyces sp. NBC_00094]|uniref:FG-GAP repeat domain-containing protein n=1 Tax=Streptomyces sp. NBC_00094 TaxID=2903620 RepID=UPI00224EBF30|nr:VCBS repeat-containing protein [Streptomyces sp. NBC_00094]MCX5392444.1 VCBS repeat-containing protein [Streptomyces sp. NBC_00094]